jgi:hypothetical protein
MMKSTTKINATFFVIVSCLSMSSIEYAKAAGLLDAVTMQHSACQSGNCELNGIDPLSGSLTTLEIDNMINLDGSGDLRIRNSVGADFNTHSIIVNNPSLNSILNSKNTYECLHASCAGLPVTCSLFTLAYNFGFKCGTQDILEKVFVEASKTLEFSSETNCGLTSTTSAVEKKNCQLVIK